MKKIKYLFFYSLTQLFLSFAVFSFVSAVPSLDPVSRTQLINKLTTVYLNLAPGDSSKIPVTLRLADLHAEKARIEAYEESTKGCLECKNGEADRRKALQYYSEVVDKIQDNSKYRVKIQIGHINDLLGQDKEAIKAYESLLVQAIPSEYRNEAEFSLGEFYFKKRQFEKAKSYYKNIIANGQSNQMGLAYYRLAWAELNSGNLQAGIKNLTEILKNSRLLSRNANVENGQIDKQFHEEVSKDLATFFARGDFKTSHVQDIYSLSPEDKKVENLVYYASEIERLGQRQSAIEVWKIALDKQSKPLARLESHMHLSQLYMLVGSRDLAVKDYENALRLWGSTQPCTDADLCKELKTRMKNFVVEWNKLEAKNPSEGLLNSYLLYIANFPNETEVKIWAAKVATDLKVYDKAFELYSSAALGASEYLEVALVGAMEVAELSKDKVLMEKGYAQYLALSKDKKRGLEVEYQKAHLLYENNQMAQATQDLRKLALSPIPGQDKLKKQAADLALDGLVILKDDINLELWSEDFAKQFPSASQEFRSISRKAVLNQVAAVDQKKASPEDLLKAWNVLLRFNLTQSEPHDQINYYKNRLILAEKLGKFSEARDATERLLTTPGVSAEDQELAWTRKAWLSEMILDFDGALQATQKIKTKDQEDQRLLKLAMYSELSGKDPKPFYTQYLQVSKDDNKKALIASELVKNSSDPMKELTKYLPMLSKNMDLLAPLYLEIFATTKSPEVAKKALAVQGLAGTTSGKIIIRNQLLKDFEAMQAEIVAHQLNSKNEKLQTASLKKRIELLTKVEKLATASVNAADWSSQLLTLDLLAKESERFYQELMTLPLPAGLTPEQEQFYLQALSQQAAPYQIKAQDVKNKVKEFWSQENSIAQMKKDVQSSYGSIRKILDHEMQLIAQIAPEAIKSTLKIEVVVKDEQKPPLQEIENARQAVRENPLQKSVLESLLNVEKKAGHTKMISYLEGRMLTLENDPSPTKRSQ